MIRRLLALAVVAGAASTLSAQQVSKRFDYSPVNGVQDISFELDKVSVNQIVFKPGKSMGAGIRKSDAAVDVRVDNNGTTDKIVGIAIAMMDADGNIVAAGSGGTRVGYLSKGERDTARIAFPFVFRHMDQAKTFLVTMELEEKK
ncbi:MAG TPA: hypothetical protein VIB08_09890 [Thermoanaerobaculia bacterium]|jgi:hypothetical protein